MELLQYSKSIQYQAMSLINNLNLKPLINCGELNFTGGYYLNLMYARDIDTIVLMDNLDLNTIIQAIHKIILQINLTKLEFRDYKKEKNKLDQRYYFHLSFNYQKEIWKLDIAFWHKESWQPGKTRDLYSYLNNIKNNLSQSDIITILKIKRELANNCSYSNKIINGKHIYDGVLNHGVKNINDLIKLNNL